MYYQSYMNYQDEYVKGLRRLSMESWKISINKETLLPDKKRAFKNYVLIFSPKGKLNTAYLYKYSDENKIDHVKKLQFAYDFKSRMKMVMEMNLFSDELCLLAEFEYDEYDRIANEQIRSFSRFSEFEKEYHHHYEKNYHSIRYFDEDLNDGLIECLHEEWHNDRGDLTAFKFWSETNGVHIWERYILNERGETELTFSLSDNGKIRETHPPSLFNWKCETVEEGKDKRTEHHFFQGELKRIDEYNMKFYELGSVDVRR